MITILGMISSYYAELKGQSGLDAIWNVPHLFRGAPGHPPLRVSLSLAMAEFPVKSFTLFMWCRVFETCSQIWILLEKNSVSKIAFGKRKLMLFLNVFTSSLLRLLAWLKIFEFFCFTSKAWLDVKRTHIKYLWSLLQDLHSWPAHMRCGENLSFISQTFE